jgi:hypothetical protein
MTTKELKEIESPFLVDIQGHGVNEMYSPDQVLEILKVLISGNDIKKYSIEDIENCVENWGLCKVEKQYIEAYLNKAV